MAELHLNIPDIDLARFDYQAQREGKTLNEWLLDAAHARMRDQRQVRRFESTEDIRAFFQACDSLEEPGTEPDWIEHLEAIRRSLAAGTKS